MMSFTYLKLSPILEWMDGDEIYLKYNLENLLTFLLILKIFIK